MSFFGIKATDDV